jgi:hypothetical protein
VAPASYASASASCHIVRHRPGSTAYRIRAAMENEPSYWPAYSLIRIGGDVDGLIARLVALELRETSALKIVDKIAFIQLKPDLLT